MFSFNSSEPTLHWLYASHHNVLRSKPFTFLKKRLGISSTLLLLITGLITLFRGVAVTCKMVVMPTAQFISGKILAEEERLDAYCVDKKLREGVTILQFKK